MGATNGIRRGRVRASRHLQRPALACWSPVFRLYSHAAVQSILASLQRAATDEYGRLCLGDKYHTQFCVTLRSKDRAVRILVALIKTLVARGNSVEIGKRYPHSTGDEIVAAEMGQQEASQRCDPLRNLVRANDPRVSSNLAHALTSTRRRLGSDGHFSCHVPASAIS